MLEWTGSTLFADPADPGPLFLHAALDRLAEPAAKLATDPGYLGDAYADHAAGRRSAGRYYTPPAIVDLALGAMDDGGGEILDPACGGGRFLLGALRRRGAECIGQLHGVDIDPTAVAVCRFALWLAVGQPAPARAHIVVGDPLRGLADVRLGLDTPGAWRPTQGRYDLVVGNPPYRGGRFASLDRSYTEAFRVAEYQLDPYPLFLELALYCAAPDGRVSMVVPNPWLSNLRCGRLRGHLLGDHGLESVVELPHDTFDAGVETVVVSLRKDGETAAEVPLRDPEGKARGVLFVDPNDPTAPLPIARDAATSRLILTSRRWRETLGDVADVTRGVNPYHHTTHTPSEIRRRVHHADHQAGPDYVPELRGRDLGAYRLWWRGNHWIRYGPWLKEPRDPRYFDGSRLLVRKILGDTLCATWLDTPFCCDQSVYIARLHDDQPWPPGALLAFVNSRVVSALLRARHQEDDRLFPQLKVAELRALPLPAVDPARTQGLSERALALQERCSELACDPEACAQETAPLRENIEGEVARLYGV